MKIAIQLTLIALGVIGSLLVTFGVVVLAAQWPWLIPFAIIAWAVAISALGSD